MSDSNEKFEVMLEKKGRGRGFALARPWTLRSFRLIQQTLTYYDGDKLKGEIPMKDAVTQATVSADAEGKEFPFHVLTAGPTPEKLMLNASSELHRQKCIEIFNKAAKDANWKLQDAPPPPPEQKEYEEAAAAAVVTAMAADAEKKRLEEEARRLEEERQKQITEAAAAALEEEAANAKLKAAKEAEEKQKREQEKQVMESFKGMGAKLRFRTAIQHGMMDDARDAAAMMLQGAWRAKVARRRMVMKRAEKEKLRAEGYAKKIQCRYRARLARKRVEAIKAEKLRIKQELCALKLQCSWRIYIARKKYRRKIEAKNELEYNKQIARARAVIVLQNKVRTFIAQRRLSKIRLSYPSVLRCSFVCVDGDSSECNNTNGFVVSDGTSTKKESNFGSESVTALVSGMILTLPRNSRELYSPQAEIVDSILSTQGKVTSLYQCKPVSTAGQREDEEEIAVATALNKMDYLVVTLVDSSASNKGDFLGQAMIRLINIPGLETGVTVEVKALLQKMKKTITNASGEALGTVRKAPNGAVTLRLSRPNPNYNLCGWLWKVSESLLSNAWKKRWFLLLDGELRYYNSDLGMENEKNVVPCSNVTAITEIEYKGRNALKVEFTSDNKENFWCIDFDEDMPQNIRRLWKRVLYRNCPQIPDPLLTSLGISARPVPTSAHKSSSQKKTALPAKKRLSIFS